MASRYGQFFGFQPYWLSIAASSVRLQGFFDAIAYGLTEGLIHRWLHFFRSWMASCCCPRTYSAQYLLSQDEASSVAPSPMSPSHDSSSIIFLEGYLWDRMVPSDVPQSNTSSISESAYYTPLTSKDLYLTAFRDRDFLYNPLDSKNYPYQYPSTG
jgi:hypothetical protein